MVIQNFFKDTIARYFFLKILIFLILFFYFIIFYLLFFELSITAKNEPTNQDTLSAQFSPNFTIRNLRPILTFFKEEFDLKFIFKGRSARNIIIFPMSVQLKTMLMH